MNIPEKIETESLILRKPVIDDAKSIFEEYTQDPDVTYYLSWRLHESVEVTKEFINGRIQAWEKGEEFS